MSGDLRGCLIGLLATLSVITSSGGAAALTVTPTGSYTLTSVGNVLLRFSSTGQTLTCTTSSIPITLGSNGRGTVPARSAIYRGCSNSLLGTFTMTQTSAWNLKVLLTTLGDGRVLVGFEADIPVLHIDSATGCLFDVTAIFNVGILLPGPLPKSISIADHFIPLGSSAETIGIPINCTPLLTVAGLRAAYSGTYSLSRGMTVSG